MPTHCAVATTALGVFDEIPVETPPVGREEILIQHAYAGMVALDTYQADLGFFVAAYPQALGLAASGIVASVGPDIKDLKVGDRVAAFTFHGSRSKATQEYSIQPRSAVAKIPNDLDLAEAATIPDNFVTAYYTLFNQLGLPIPQFPVLEPPALAAAPILVYGAGSISGQYTIQVLHAAGYQNIIVTASPKHHDYLRSLGATHVFDYRSPTLVQDIQAVAAANTEDGKVQYALDSIGSQGTVAIVSEVISPSGKLALLLPIKEGSSIRGASDARMVLELPEDWNILPKGVTISYVSTLTYDQDEFLRENVMPKILPQLLELGLIKPSKLRLMNGVSGEKVIVKIDL
ncbi:hypothetical protein ONZ45_g9266 [Pleurotus djamor]|nr:hypothetical protein ONZ45_g9266 [Pleurotus djamor]